VDGKIDCEDPQDAIGSKYTRDRNPVLRYTPKPGTYLLAGQGGLNGDTPLAGQEEQRVEGEEESKGDEGDLLGPDPLVIAEEIDECPGRVQENEGPDIGMLGPGQTRVQG